MDLNGPLSSTDGSTEVEMLLEATVSGQLTSSYWPFIVRFTPVCDDQVKITTDVKDPKEINASTVTKVSSPSHPVGHYFYHVIDAYYCVESDLSNLSAGFAISDKSNNQKRFETCTDSDWDNERPAQVCI